MGQVIKGWDVGVNGNYLNGLTPLFLYEFGYCLNIDFADPLSGMRIGDKRRLTIPPSMGYVVLMSFIAFGISFIYFRSC